MTTIPVGVANNEAHGSFSHVPEFIRGVVNSRRPADGCGLLPSNQETQRVAEGWLAIAVVVIVQPGRLQTVITK